MYKEGNIVLSLHEGEIANFATTIAISNLVVFEKQKFAREMLREAFREFREVDLHGL